jgi:hypothetical protein
MMFFNEDTYIYTKATNIFATEQIDISVTFQTCIKVIRCSNLGRESGYHDFS